MRVKVRRSHQRRCAPIQGKLVASPTRFISTRPSCAESLKSFPATTTRRGLLLGLGVIIAAPAIVRFDNIMPVRALAPELLAVNGPDREPVLVWWCEPPCLSATMQKWEDYLAAVKTVPDNALGKEHVIERAKYLIEVKRQRGDHLAARAPR
jgi:hypothetical protein